jgi:sugar lactone lactonase YvrE
VQELVTGFSLLEAPAVDQEGGVWFSDVLNGGVHRWTPGGVQTVVPKRRGIGGLALHAEGGAVVTGRDVSHVKDGETRQLLAIDGVTGFNDLGIAPDGSVYVGSLRFMPFGGEPPVPGEIWRIGSDGATRQVAGGIDWANGIGFSPDGATAYASDYAHAKVLAFDVSEGGSLEEPRTFASIPAGSADGLAVDAQGRVWVAMGDGGGIARFDPHGTLDRVVDVPGDFVSSLCFGGDDMRDLYVTTMGTLFRGRSHIPGLPVLLATV